MIGTKKKYHRPSLQPKKRLGQVLLRDTVICEKIAAAMPENAVILEIGPGDGALTTQLLTKGHRVVGVEIDLGMAEEIQLRLKKYTGFNLITGDVLKLDWKNIKNISESFVVAGNLPYHLTSPILFSIFDYMRNGSSPIIYQVVVMVQKEVGQRIAAHVGDSSYSGLSVLAQFHADIEYLMTVPSSSFYPQPKVDGAVIRLKLKPTEDLPDIDYLLFRRIVRACFAQRRKMMRNSLRVAGPLPDGWDKLDFDFTKRPEQFSFEEFLSLAQKLNNIAQPNP